MSKPMSVSAFLAEGLPQQKEKTGIPLKNRFLALTKDRDRSVSSQRGASPHKRRRGDSEFCESESEDVSGPEVDPNRAFKSMADEEASFKKAREIVESVKGTLSKATEEEISGPLKKVLGGIVEWMEITTGVQVTTASVVVDSFAKVASPRKSRADDGEKKAKKTPEEELKSQEERELEEKKKKFMHEVKEAERSVLVFKTNMGTAPVMNPDTMRKKFSADLSARAAAVENLGESRPSTRVVAQLDDTLSMVTRMEYFGRETKKAVKLDENKVRVEEDYYTIPVKLSFKDKKTREAAEARIRTLCKMYGTVPYHRTLRNAMNAIIEESKQKYKGDYIQARLVADKMQVKVSRRDQFGVWHDNIEVVDLPLSVLETGKDAGMKPRVNINRMDTDEGQGSQG
jgi:hypothetical protein